MAYDDKTDGLIFPIRTGTPIGQANERKMLDGMGDTGGFRTKMRTNSDGSTTMLRTKGGMPEFSTVRNGSYASDGGVPSVKVTCNLFLNSGIVDLVGAGLFSPNINEVGKIHQTDFVSGSIPTTGVGAGNVKVEIDAKGNQTYSLTDTLPISGSEAQSFGAKYGDYQTKKNVAWNVPASVFTGRTRFYVQSLYGGINKTILLSIGPSVRPMLAVTTQQREDAGTPAILIGTGTGIYYDKVDHTHWMIIPGAASAVIMKMRTNFCAERIRAKLASPDLTEAEKERIESYVLSHSIPDLEDTPIQEVFYDMTPTDSMGYSWHFNWDGDTCDIVNVDEVLVRVGAYGFESTHYRLKFSRDTTGNFSVVRTVEAGPSRWSVPKNINVIAYPDWIVGKLVKAGNLPSGISDANQNGLVYAFYRKNELQLVNYTGVTTSHLASRSSSPSYFGGLHWTSPPGMHINSFESGVTTGNNAWTGMRHEFSCAGITVGGENGVAEKDEITGTWNGRTNGYEIGVSQVTGGPLTQYIGVPTLSDFVYNEAGTVSSYTTTWTETVTVGVGPYIHTSTCRDEFTVGSKYYEEIKGAFSLIVIPFMDSQAVYMSGSLLTHKIGDQTTGTRHVGSTLLDRLWQWDWEGHPEYPLTDYFNKYYPATLNSLGASDGEPPDVASPLDETTMQQQGCALICSAGAFSASPADVSPFYSALDYVDQSWGTIASVNGVVFSQSNNVYQGSPIYPLYPSLVGWA